MNLSSQEQSRRAQVRWSKTTKRERFFERVDLNGPTVRPELGPCWVWVGASSRGPYGVCRDLKGITTSAHRVAWMLENGEIPVGIQVCHRCDNPKCVRVAHLFLGTPLENARDRVCKGRQSRKSPVRPFAVGSKNIGAVLSEHTVRSILLQWREGKSQAEIARRTGATRANVWAIVHRKSWTHISPQEVRG